MTGIAALVWFKRELGARDHAPLAEAVRFDSAIGLAVIEPQWLESPECDPSHVGLLLALQIVAGLAAAGADPIMADGASDAAVEGSSGRSAIRPSCRDTAKAVAAWTQRGARSPMLYKPWGDGADVARASRARVEQRSSPRGPPNIRGVDHTDKEPDDCPRDA